MKHLFAVLALTAGLLAAPPQPARAGGAPQVTSVCYAFGLNCNPVPADGIIDYVSPLVFTFSSPVQPKAIATMLKITPGAKLLVTAPLGAYRVAVRWHRLLGTQYHVSIGSYTIAVSAPSSVSIPKRTYANDRPYFYGLMLHPSAFKSAARVALLSAAQKAGIQFVRAEYFGRSLWPGRKGDLNGADAHWQTEDGIVNALAAHAITEMPTCLQYGIPSWEGPGTAIWQSPRDYARFCGLVAAHLRAFHPNVRRIELMNEPNQAYWWAGAPAEYASDDGTATAAYLKSAYAAVKRNNPSLTVVGPGLASGGPQHHPFPDFLTNLYAAGCRTGVCWDVLSVHVYPWATDPTTPEPATDEGQFGNDKLALAIADANHDTATHIMITEFAYSTDPGPFGVEPPVQALFTALALNAFGSDPRIDGVVYSDLYDGEDHGPLYGTDGLGIVNGRTFLPKPSFSVYERFTHP